MQKLGSLRKRPAAAIFGVVLAVSGLLAPVRGARAGVEAVCVRLEEAHCSS